MNAAQAALIFQFQQIAPDRFAGNRELFGQVICIDFSVPDKLFENFQMAFM